MPALSASPAARLTRLRRLTSAQGVAIRTSRRSTDDGMMLIDLADTFIVAGGGCPLDLDGITLWLTSLTAGD